MATESSQAQAIITEEFPSIITYRILGITEDGSKFRPSGWVDMLIFPYNNKEHLIENGGLRGVIERGVKNIEFNSNLQDYNNSLYNHLVNFSITNDLVVTKA